MTAKKLCLILVLNLNALLVACGGDQAAFSDADLATALVEVSVERTQAAQGSTSESQSTPAPMLEAGAREPTNSPEPSPTGPHGDGVYLVGAEIAAGLWRSIADDQRFCYWARRKYDGIVLGSYYGLPGGDLIVRPSDYEVELDGCGVWVFMGES